MHVVRRCVFLAGSVLLAASSAAAQGGQALSAQNDPHSTPEWAIVAPHLPDPLHAPPATLETAGDILRARRFPEDAITFYRAAADTGGVTSRLLKKEGVVHLELQHGLLAHLCFQQAVRLNKKDSEAWNDLGASDFMLGNHFAAVGEYKHAVRLNRESAIFRSNLSLAYFEIHESRNARRELARAFALDPDVLHHNGIGGYNLQVLGSTHYAEICFEMARVYATQGDRTNTIEWLTKAAERGMDVRRMMRDDPALGRYLDDETVKTMLDNNDLRHVTGTGHDAAAGHKLFSLQRPQDAGAENEAVLR